MKIDLLSEKTYSQNYRCYGPGHGRGAKAEAHRGAPELREDSLQPSQGRVLYKRKGKDLAQKAD